MPTDEAVSQQLVRANDMSIPLAVRPTMSAPIDGNVRCNDAPRLNDVTRAKVVKPGEDLTNLRAPPDTGTIDRNQPIAVIRGENAEIDEYVTQVGGQGATGMPAAEPVYAERPSPERSEGIAPAFEETVQVPPPQVGVISTAKETAVVSQASPAPQVIKEATAPAAVPAARPANPQASTAVVPQATVVPAAKPEGEFFQSDNIILGQASRFPRLNVKKQKVIFRSSTMGCIRAKVSAVSIDKGIIAIGYIDDEDTVIVEPPVGDSSTPFSVEIAGTEYMCVYYGHSFELMLPGFFPDTMLLVVLIRKED